MENKYLAKSEKEKSIKEHTDDLLRQCKILKNMYPHILYNDEWEILELAIKFHDLGKINSKFQNKLYQALGYGECIEDYNIKAEEVPHNYLSPFFIDGPNYENIYGRKNTEALISAVYYHHDRDIVDYDKEEIKKELNKQVENLEDFYGLDLRDVKKRFNGYLLKKYDEELISKKYIMIKGLLNKLDYIASLDKDGVNIEEDTKDNGKDVSEKIQDLVENNFGGNYREVQNYMREKQNENIIVISPCGSGKTEAALLWIGGKKAFYTLPLKVSINAIYERIKEKIGYKKGLLLHSDAFQYYLENDRKEEADINAYSRAKRLSAPLIITTVDQLFRIVFRYNGYEEILSTLSYSKVIIDEIQMYSPIMIAYILIGLKMITDVGGKFAIMTATFPPVLYNFLDILEIPYVKQETIFKPNIEKRHKIEVIREQKIDTHKVKEFGKIKKVLVIVNTIGEAQRLYDELIDENVHLLHSHYIKKHRKMLEDEILRFTNRNENKENGIWISTQIVEASLDIDFDVLFTEMSSLDSLFQRMGRVYRSREYLGEIPNVYIHDDRNGVPKIINGDIYKFSLEEIAKYSGKEISEYDKQTMIENVFDKEKNNQLEGSKYYKEIEENISIFKDIIPYEMEKEEVKIAFRNISSISLIPDNIFEELNNIGKIEEWDNIFSDNSCTNMQKAKIKNEIDKYVINVTYTRNLIYDKQELFYKGSNIFRTMYTYEFNYSKLKGKGLIMKIEERNNQF